MGAGVLPDDAVDHVAGHGLAGHPGKRLHPGFPRDPDVGHAGLVEHCAKSVEREVGQQGAHVAAAQHDLVHRPSPETWPSAARRIASRNAQPHTP